MRLHLKLGAKGRGRLFSHEFGFDTNKIKQFLWDKINKLEKGS
jgi:hypothetical protein